MLDYFALFLIFFVFLVIFYGIIAIHDIPYLIAVKRQHPQQDAIHYAGWISLFTLHAIWPFLWIWAAMRKPGTGWKTEPDELAVQLEVNKDLQQQLSVLKTDLDTLKTHLSTKEG